MQFSRLEFSLVFIIALIDASLLAQEQQEAPAVLPSTSSFSFRMVGSQLQAVQAVGKDESQFWLEPLSIYFLNKKNRENVELTNEQVEVIEAIEKDYQEFQEHLGRQSVKFFEMAKDETGKVDINKYKQLIKRNFKAKQEHNVGLEKRLRATILPHQWKQMAESVTRKTLQSQGVANHVTNAQFASYLKLSDKQKGEMLAVAQKLVKENDAKLKKMAQDSMKKLLDVLSEEQQKKLLKAVDLDSVEQLGDIHIVVLNEQLRRFVEQSSKMRSAGKKRK